MSTETVLRNSRCVITELLEKTWEFGGVSEEEFNNYSFIQQARKQVNEICTELGETPTYDIKVNEVKRTFG